MKGQRGCMAVLAMSLLVLTACSGNHDRGQATAAAPRWRAVAHGQVDVQGGTVLVTARTDGVVTAIAVQPGDHVSAGQVLARLDARAADIAVASAAAGVAQARARLAQAQAERQQADRRGPRVVAAAKAGAASGDAAAQAQAAVALGAAQQAAAQAGLASAEQQLALARLHLEATTLRAPDAGVVVARELRLGQAVTAQSGTPVFEILPERPHIVRAQLDADAANAIHRGMHAEVIRESGDGPVYTATVLWVGQMLQPASLTRDPLQRALANDVECVLLLAPAHGPAPSPLRIGQRVLVRFPQDRESVPKGSGY